MKSISRSDGFTLVELLTVIAIIAVLAAILFPLAGSVRENARSADCMTKLHQLYVAARVYRDDEGAFPPALLGYVEQPATDAGCTSDPSAPRYIPYDGTGSPVKADQVINGFLYREMVKDLSVFRCSDSDQEDKGTMTVAHFPNMQSGNSGALGYWPGSWIGDVLASKGCPTDSYGTVDCFWDVDPADPCLGRLAGKPRYFYTTDSYDVSPRVLADGSVARDNSGNRIYDRRYSRDWTGVRGLSDMTNQMKYTDPPADKTLLTFCTWHAVAGQAKSVNAISLGGTARKIDLSQVLHYGPDVYNH